MNEVNKTIEDMINDLSNEYQQSYTIPIVSGGFISGKIINISRFKPSVDKGVFIEGNCKDIEAHIRSIF